MNYIAHEHLFSSVIRLQKDGLFSMTVCNRGRRPPYAPPFYRFTMKKPHMLKSFSSFSNKLLDDNAPTWEFYLMMSKLSFGRTKPLDIEKTNQKIGNCTVKNRIAALEYALTTLETDDPDKLKTCKTDFRTFLIDWILENAPEEKKKDIKKLISDYYHKKNKRKNVEISLARMSRIIKEINTRLSKK